MTRDTEKCPLSLLTSVTITQVNVREIISAFHRDQQNYPIYTGAYSTTLHSRIVHNKNGYNWLNRTILKEPAIQRQRIPQIQNPLKRTNYKCVVPENIHTPPQKGLGGGGGGVSHRPQNLSKCMKLDWNFQRGGGLRKNPFHSGDMDNFWHHTMYFQSPRKVLLKP